MERIADSSSVVGDFGGRTLAFEDGARAEMSAREGRFFVRTNDATGRVAEYRVLRTIGHVFKQRYVTENGDGNEYVLPVQWNVRGARWDAYPGPTEPFAPAKGSWASPANAWERNCAGCHVTGLEVAVEGPLFRERYVELGLGCESCHGPGRAHVESPETPGLAVHPARLSFERQVDLCARCHSRGEAGPAEGAPGEGFHYPCAFLPGEALAARFRIVEPEIGKKTKHFWPDGASSSHHQQAHDFRRDPHFTKGGMVCTSCHDPHQRARYGGLREDPRDNSLCLDCHTRRREDLTSHTHHRADSRGSVCIDCHMPRLVENGNPFELRSHTRWRPDPAKAMALGMPDACTLCHKDRTQAWAASLVNSWKFGEPTTDPGIRYPAAPK
jgi:predicted CXXCH cytochrome family protein